MVKNDIYFSLDEARKELRKRWDNVELRKRIEEELGENFWTELKEGPRCLLWRCLFSPDNGFTFFYQCAKYINAEPLGFEFLDDKFVSINEEKNGLARVKLLDDGKKEIDLVSFGENEGKKVKEVYIYNGEKLVDFHHSLFGKNYDAFQYVDKSDWLNNFNGPLDYYYSYLLHFVSHGVLFETFVEDEDSRESSFTGNIVIPNLKKIEEKFGFKPIIVRLYPDDQTDEEDFYWWCYPPNINEYLLSYSKKNNLKFKNL